MKEDYPFGEIEAKWQSVWDQDGAFETNLEQAKNPYYCLMMFPYPSGKLHVGHGRNYIIGDAVARYKKMQGFDVLTPMGWDAFGLPAENAAIKTGTPPAAYTRANIATMKQQLRAWGCMYDWKKEVTSCEPDYYRWTQWLFLQLHERGLAYKKEAPVNWDPVDQTVLANEQVLPDGTAERSGAKVETRMLSQWFFKITDYAQRLLDDLDKLEGWPERVKTMQKNWIGRSEGTEIYFSLVSRSDGVKDAFENVPCFTTRVDTIYGCTYMSVAPEHPQLKEWISGMPQEEAVLEFIKDSAALNDIDRQSDTREKRGVFTGRFVINPYTGEEVPLWVADYVLMYGTGAVMAVPAHDTRDWSFAKKYDLNIIPVVRPLDSNDNFQKASLELAKSGLKTAVVSKVFPTRSHTVSAQGGITCAIASADPNDDWRWHMYDTVKGADFIGDQDAIEYLCSEGPKAVFELEHMGLPFSRFEGALLMA